MWMILFSALMLLGPRNEIPPSLFREMEGRHHGNGVYLPDPSSLRAVPWVGEGKYRVGEVMCESLWLPEKEPQAMCPRYACRKQLRRLADAGYTVKSGFEFEFRLEDPKTHEPVFSGNDALIHTEVGRHAGFLFQAEKYFHERGILVEKIQTEYGPGQFEITLREGDGIQAIDDTFTVKHGLKEIAGQHDLFVNFMTKPDPLFSANSMHFNHSLWTMEGKNALHDAIGEHLLSDVARHWTAGLLAHCKALTAFCSPSVNCYRRLHGVWTPHTVSWGLEDRVSTFRMKNETPDATYLENRLVGGVCNPYLVMAAHVAAGLDGIARRLECPPPSQTDAEDIPHTLEEALKALEDDVILTEALGKELVDWFLTIKREIDLSKLADSDMKVNDNTKAYQAERELYSPLL